MTQAPDRVEYARACEAHIEVVLRKEQELRDELARTGRRIRVHHYVTVPLQYFFSLGEAFASDDRYDYVVHLSDTDPEILELFASRGISTRPASLLRTLTSARPDVLFLQHPYVHIGDVEIDFYGIMSRLPGHILPRRAEEQPLLALVPYAFTVINDELHRPVDGFHDLPIHNVGWRIFCETEWHRQRAAEKSTMHAWNWVSTGYPKLDDLTGPAPDDGVGGARIRRIIWAPHHNRTFQGLPIPDVHQMLAGYLEARPDLGLVFRPHPNLLKQGYDFSAIGMTETHFQDVCQFWGRHPRGSFDMRADLPSLFAESDLMVTDCGGFQAEYVASMRPLVSYIRPGLLNGFADELTTRANYTARTVAEIEALLRQLVDRGDDPKLTARQASLAALRPTGHAGRAIVESIAASLLPAGT